MRRLPIAVVLVWALCTVPAFAAFPGENGKVAFRDGSNLFTVEPDGTNLTPLGSGRGPAWSPGGAQIAFVDASGQISRMNADGTGRTPLTTGFGRDPAWSPDGSSILFARYEEQSECLSTRALYRMDASGGEASGVAQVVSSSEDAHLPRWSPDGSKIAYIRQVWSDASDPPLYCDVFSYPPELAVMNADGTGMQTIGQGMIEDFDWSPDGSRIVYSMFGTELRTIRPDGTEDTQLTNTSSGPASNEAYPVWSPDGTKIAFESGSHLYVMNADGTGVADLVDTSATFTFPDWQPLHVDAPSAYVRPQGATPMRVSLVPAYTPCMSPNRTHGSPLAADSCAPPALRSPRLTLGGNGTPARSIGFVRIAATSADASLRTELTNVMRTSDGSDYPGELRTSVTVRRTDTEGGIGATSADFPFDFTVPCAPTSGPGGSTCAATTTVNAVIPGALPAGATTIWELDAVHVYDGGPDEDAGTGADEVLLATQGVFVP